MPRNAPVVLTDTLLLRVSTNRAMLAGREGERVTLDYEKRNGEATILAGEIISLIGTRKGNESTEAVVLMTDKGERSANLFGIRAIN